HGDVHDDRVRDVRSSTRDRGHDDARDDHVLHDHGGHSNIRGHGHDDARDDDHVLHDHEHVRTQDIQSLPAILLPKICCLPSIPNLYLQEVLRSVL
ncbi:MAG: hypothetical protein IJC38_04425, partial [Erysipelotrichaceae bacterium]|nr:hypothetical protein [Erysipelotrichaceae bacterium]